MRNHRGIILLLILILLSVINTVQTQETEKRQFYWDKVSFPVFYITDKPLMTKLANELLLPLDSTTQQLAIVDLNFNGLGVKDVVVALPQCVVYPIEVLSFEFAEKLQELPAPPVRSIFFQNDSTLVRIDSTRMPDVGMIRKVHQQIQKTYPDKPIKLSYTRRKTGVEFEIFKFDTFSDEFWNLSSIFQKPDSTVKGKP